MRPRRRRTTWAASVLSVAATLGCPVALAGAAASSTVKIDGVYRIVSTDCYFAAGECHARFDVEQSGTVLSDPTDRYFHGRVKGDRVKVGEQFPRGTSEDSWVAIGTTSNGGKTVSGNFYDGIGGSGAFTMTFVGPLVPAASD